MSSVQSHKAPQDIHLSEIDSSAPYDRAEIITYSISHGGKPLCTNQMSLEKHSKQFVFQRILTTLKNVFLPDGYPSSVSEDYLSYQFWDTIQAFASSLSGAIATHSVLLGLGVGKESASALSSTITWIMKDGFGMMGRILFAWSKGTDLDHDAKRWRLTADILNDCAMCADILSPLLPQTIFFPCLCISSVARSIVGVAGGATRATLTQHQSINNNMADVSAKDGSQETLVNLSAMLVSVVMLSFISNSPMLTWLVFFFLVILHLYANFRAVKAVEMKTLNYKRYEIILDAFLSDQSVLHYKQANSTESVLSSSRISSFLTVGCSLADVKVTLNSELVLDHLYKYHIFVFADTSSTFTILQSTKCDSKSFLFAIFIVFKLKREGSSPSMDDLYEQFEMLYNSLQAKGWHLDYLNMPSAKYKILLK